VHPVELWPWILGAIAKTDAIQAGSPAASGGARAEGGEREEAKGGREGGSAGSAGASRGLAARSANKCRAGRPLATRPGPPSSRRAHKAWKSELKIVLPDPCPGPQGTCGKMGPLRPLAVALLERRPQEAGRKRNRSGRPRAAGAKPPNGPSGRHLTGCPSQAAGRTDKRPRRAQTVGALGPGRRCPPSRRSARARAASRRLRSRRLKTKETRRTGPSLQQRGRSRVVRSWEEPSILCQSLLGSCVQSVQHRGRLTGHCIQRGDRSVEHCVSRETERERELAKAGNCLQGAPATEFACRLAPAV